MRIAVLFAIGCGASGPTTADLEKAQSLVHPMQPLAEGKAAVVGALGEPVKTDDAGMHWYASDSGCKELVVGVIGESIGSVEVKDSKDCP